MLEFWNLMEISNSGNMVGIHDHCFGHFSGPNVVFFLFLVFVHHGWHCGANGCNLCVFGMIMVAPMHQSDFCKLKFFKFQKKYRVKI